MARQVQFRRREARLRHHGVWSQYTSGTALDMEKSAFHLGQIKSSSPRRGGGLTIDGTSMWNLKTGMASCEVLGLSVHKKCISWLLPILFKWRDTHASSVRQTPSGKKTGFRFFGGGGSSSTWNRRASPCSLPSVLQIEQSCGWFDF